MSIKDIHVPDIGDFKQVPVIEIFVKPGDRIDAETPIAAVESEKATMDIPSPLAGTIVELAIGVGDPVSEGTLLARIEVEGAGAAMPVGVPAYAGKAPAAQPPAASATAATAVPEDAIDLVVIGGGPGGYSAAFRAADLGLRVALVEREATLGGVCLNVGCIPSKALLHVAAVKEEAERLSAHGISFGTPLVDLDRLRAFKAGVVNKLTSGLAFMAKTRKVTVIRGTATFTDTHHLDVALEGGGSDRIAFRSCIIAAGSEPVHLPFLPQDPRIVDSTGALDLPFVPKRMLVIGGGIIGLEMATVYSALGSVIDVVEQFDGLLAGVDRDLEKLWMGQNKHRFGRIMTSTRLVSIEAGADGLHVVFDGKDAGPATYDLVLQAVGRRPAGSTLKLEAAGLAHDRSFIPVDDQMRTKVAHIFAIGDIVGQPMLAHKAVHQGHVAAESAAGHKTGFDAKVIPSVAYTAPEIAWVGLTEAEARAQGIAVKVARFPWAASGRAVANGADHGVTKLVLSADTGRVVGGAIVGPSAGDLIGEICLAIEMGADAVDIGKTIHPHPTLGESIGMAAEVALGACTDLPPP
ncbi:dihydrolipoyl dehydrogenase [Xanthobacter dioxanivorans]|uniref:Dihydrolipoyl dehydrogenase n=1 Tax=Xanthobacter dioxanivorans TaxID=2528964 RepID=A0A974SK77_9HYPH|nr:dihydrolipoyl dehydrogenase [Xanthobacter dioxanivorans]QRG07238.1 dihydrolipoyl dehydrogenase [Xanthobacter dioxanivorans]